MRGKDTMKVSGKRGQLRVRRDSRSMNLLNNTRTHGSIFSVFVLLFMLGLHGRNAGSQELIWQRTEPGAPGGVAVDSQGNVVMLNTRGEHEIIKYDPQGEILWRATDGTGLSGTLTVDADDNILKMAERAFVTKISPDGEILWMADMRDICWMLWGIACDSEGNVYVTADNFGMQLIKLNPDGEVLWTVDEGWWGWGTVEADPWGDVIVGWYEMDWRINKYSSTGEKIWERVVGGPGQEMGADICVDTEGNIYLAGDWIVKYDRDGNLIWFDPDGLRGWYVSYDGLANIYIGMNESYEPAQIARYDLDGNLIWIHPLAGGSDQSVSSVACSGANRLAVQMITSDHNQIIAAMYWVASIKADKENTVFHQLLKIYPNPINSGATIIHLYNEFTGNTIAIHDLKGRMVRRLETTGDRTFWDGRDDKGLRVCPGTYVCRLVSGGVCRGQAYLVVTR